MPSRNRNPRKQLAPKILKIEDSFRNQLQNYLLNIGKLFSGFVNFQSWSIENQVYWWCFSLSCQYSLFKIEDLFFDDISIAFLRLESSIFNNLYLKLFTFGSMTSASSVEAWSLKIEDWRSKISSGSRFLLGFLKGVI